MKKILFTAFILTVTLGYTQVQDHEGNTYKTTQIGDQTWMAENLNVITFKNGDKILHAKTLEEWRKAGKEAKPAWCYYENKEANGDKYGVLYNWHAIADPRGMAPDGYKIPSEEDFLELIKNLGTDSASKIKSKSGWANDSNGSNISGFNGKPSGLRSVVGNFQDESAATTWWSSTGVEPQYLWSAKNLHIMISEKEAKIGSTSKNHGFYLRCMKE